MTLRVEGCPRTVTNFSSGHCLTLFTLKESFATWVRSPYGWHECLTRHVELFMRRLVFPSALHRLATVLGGFISHTLRLSHLHGPDSVYYHYIQGLSSLTD